MCARSFVLGRLSGEGGASGELRLVSFGVLCRCRIACFVRCCAVPVRFIPRGVSTHYLRALERTRYDRTNHLT